MKNILISIGLGLFIAFIFFLGAGLFYRHYDLIIQSPILIKIQSPIVFKSRDTEKKIVKPKVIQLTPIKSPTPTPKKKGQVPVDEYTIVHALKYGDATWRVYGLESTWGKNDYCRKNGLGYGGFGVLDGKGGIVCYDTFEKAAERGQHWLVQNGLEKNLVNALCTYNQGCQKGTDGECLRDTKGNIMPWQNCNYYQSYLTVLN